MSARWGHDSVYVEKDNAVYIVGGEISGSGIQITNEVLKIDVSPIDRLTNPLSCLEIANANTHPASIGS
jgi:hypothetical protein